MIKINELKPWHPDKPTSKGANAFHNAVINASWNNDNIIELIKIMQEKIRENDVVVDFGTGTGASALRLLERIRFDINLWLVDNSISWLTKAYEIFSNNPKVKCFPLEKIEDKYSTLAETIGKGEADHVISANVVHLIPNLEQAFNGINLALKLKGTFSFGSGNVVRDSREEGILMIDDTVEMVHDIALEIVRKNSKFAMYRKDLDRKVSVEENQRKAIFPQPRPLEAYLKALKKADFMYEEPQYRPIKVLYSDWLNLLRVKRLEAGILPEIGGKEPSPEEEQDRDELITMATNQLFKELETKNPFADDKSFTAEWVYVTAVKEK